MIMMSLSLPRTPLEGETSVAARRETAKLGERSDESLMGAYCSGKTDALGELFDRYALRVEALVRRSTGDAALARDITQTTFLSLVRGRSRYPQDCQFRPWLFTIAMNALRDHLRRRKREVLTSSDALLAHDEFYVERFRDAGLQRALTQALSQLSLEQRQVIVLHQLEEFSFAEIAEIVGCSRSAAKVRAHRGYEKLRNLLGDTYAEIR